MPEGKSSIRDQISSIKIKIIEYRWLKYQMNIDEIQAQIIEEFSALEDGFEKYTHIVNLGKSLAPLDKEYRTEENLISGCQSNVWLKGEIKDKKIYFSADSDALITKGIIALLLRVVNNQSPEDILNNSLYFIDQIGLSSNLSPVRGNGLFSVVNSIKSFAQKHF
jgi:cysteine desulfuration protein SufE